MKSRLVLYGLIGVVAVTNVTGCSRYYTGKRDGPVHAKAVIV